MDETSEGPATWLTTPRWYLWEGGFLVIARTTGQGAAHAHHALQIVIALSGQPDICDERGEWRTGQGIAVQPDVRHTFDGRGADGAMLFIDPDSSEGAWLASALAEPITILPPARVDRCAVEIRRFREKSHEALDAGSLIHHCVRSLVSAELPLRLRDSRITSTLAKIRASTDLRLSLEDCAASVFLSPSRFAHLFTQQVGLPFRRYILWCKLTRAMLAIGKGHTMTTAAQLADFSDAAHLTRTFRQMFGISPSVMMRGEFFQITSPFTAHG